jgi:uncharacterized protein
MDDEPAGRFPIVVLGVAFEAGLAVLAWGIGWLVGVSPVQRLRMDLKNAAVGVAATGPLLLLFFWSLRSRLRSFLRIRAFFAEVVLPLFGACSILELALISIAAGVGEELLFRGLIQALAVHWLGPAAGLAVASVLFGLLHPITPGYVVLAGLMGAYLGLLALVTDNLLAAIVTHALYDFLALVYLLRGPSSKRAESRAAPEPDFNGSARQ